MLLTELIKRQGNERDQDFAARLGISAGHWGRTKRGERRLSIAVLSGAVRAFPDLGEKGIEFLRGEAEPVA